MVMEAHEETKSEMRLLARTKIGSSTIRQEKKERVPDVDKAHWEKQEQPESKTSRRPCSPNSPTSRSSKKHIDQATATQEILNTSLKVPLLPVRNQAAGRHLLHSKAPSALGILRIQKIKLDTPKVAVTKWIAS